MSHHSGEEKDALGFGPHRIGTLVSMATDSSHIYVVKMGEHLVSTIASSVYISLLLLAGKEHNHNSPIQMSKFDIPAVPI